MAVSQTARSVMLAALALLAAFALYTTGTGSASPSVHEGISLWVVRDSTPPPAALAQWPGYARASLSGALARARALDEPPLYYLLLDAWLLLAGDSLLAARLPSALWGLLALALVHRAAGRLMGRRAAWLALALLAASPLAITYTREAWPYASLVVLLSALAALLAIYGWHRLPDTPRARLGGWTLLLLALAGLQIAALARFTPARDHWPPLVDWVADNRQPLEPLITQIDPRSPLAYYWPALRQGITLDLGWQPQPVEAMRAYAAAVGDSPVIWLVLPVGDAGADALLQALAGDYQVDKHRQAGGMGFHRFERRGS